MHLSRELVWFKVPRLRQERLNGKVRKEGGLQITMMRILRLRMSYLIYVFVKSALHIMLHDMTQTPHAWLTRRISIHRR